MIAARSVRLARRTSGPSQRPTLSLWYREGSIPARDRLVAGGVGDRPHLAGEFGGRDHADAGDAQEHDVGRAGQQAGHPSLQLGDLLQPVPPLIIQGYEYHIVNR
jgi:hypothetical protein